MGAKNLKNKLAKVDELVPIGSDKYKIEKIIKLFISLSLINFLTLEACIHLIISIVYY